MFCILWCILRPPPPNTDEMPKYDKCIASLKMMHDAKSHCGVMRGFDQQKS